MYNLTSKDKPPPTWGTVIRHYGRKAGPLTWIVVVALVIIFYMAYASVGGRRSPESVLDVHGVDDGGTGQEDSGVVDANLAVVNKPDVGAIRADDGGTSEGGDGRRAPDGGGGDPANDENVAVDAEEHKEGGEHDVKIAEGDVRELDPGGDGRGAQKNLINKIKNILDMKQNGVTVKAKPKVPFNVHNHFLDEVDEDYILAQHHNKDPNVMPVLPKFDPNRHIHGALPDGEVFYPSPKVFPVAQILSPQVDHCPKVYPFVLIIVSTHTNQSKHRNSIRRTWGKQANFQPTARRTSMPWWVVFSMGTSDGIDDVVREESNTHGDIIQGDFVDHPSEETRKTLQALKWATEHLPASCRPSFLLRTECSVFVNTPLLTKWITGHFSQSLSTYTGQLIRDDVPIRDLRNSLYVSYQDYTEDTFPPFIQGPSYLLSMDVATAMVALIRQIPPIAMEDAYIGLLAERMQQEPKNQEPFKVIDRPHNVCHYLEMMFIRTGKPTVHHQIFSVVNLREKKCLDAREL